MAVLRYDIPDDFELGNVPFDPSDNRTVPDYHSLSEEEIFELLQIAHKDQRSDASIHCRLIQGILTQKTVYLSELFLAVQHQPDQHREAAKKMFDIMSYDD